MPSFHFRMLNLTAAHPCQPAILLLQGCFINLLDSMKLFILGSSCKRNYMTEIYYWKLRGQSTGFQTQYLKSLLVSLEFGELVQTSWCKH